MAKIGIVTDTTNCLPPELIKQYGISVVPIGLVLGGKVYRDQVEITPDEFWERFKKLKEMPGTSAPSPGDFETAFADLSKRADSILCILVSKILSATNDSAVVAKKNFLEKNPKLNIEIIDSKCAAGALGFLVLEAARSVQAGKSFEEVIKLVQDMLPRATYLTALESMKYLIKGGRAPKVAAIGDMMGVKPIIGNNKENGAVASLDRGRGKKKTMEKLVDMVADFVEPGKPIHMMVHYTTDLKDGEKLKELVSSRYDCVELYMTPYTPVMAAHTGPVISLGFYSG